MIAAPKFKKGHVGHVTLTTPFQRWFVVCVQDLLWLI